MPRKARKPTMSKRRRKGEGQPRKVQPCGCNSWWNEGDKKRHKSTCPHSRKDGPRSDAEIKRVAILKRTRRMATKNKRKATMRLRAIKAFNWDVLQVASCEGAKNIKGFKWVLLDSKCVVCGDETSSNVDLRTMKKVVCDPCYLGFQKGVDA